MSWAPSGNLIASRQVANPQFVEFSGMGGIGISDLIPAPGAGYRIVVMSYDFSVGVDTLAAAVYMGFVTSGGKWLARYGLKMGSNSFIDSKVFNNGFALPENEKLTLNVSGGATTYVGSIAMTIQYIIEAIPS